MIGREQRVTLIGWDCTPNGFSDGLPTVIQAEQFAVDAIAREIRDGWTVDAIALSSVPGGSFDKTKGVVTDRFFFPARFVALVTMSRPSPKAEPSRQPVVSEGAS